MKHDIRVIVHQVNKSKICKVCSSIRKISYANAYVKHEGSDSPCTFLWHFIKS